MICKSRRKELGLTCNQIDKILGSSSNCANKWESGQAVPRGGKLIEYAELLGLPVPEVLADILKEQENLKIGKSLIRQNVLTKKDIKESIPLIPYLSAGCFLMYIL